MTWTIPEQTKQLIQHYRNLEISGVTVQTPYYRNVKRARAGLRSLIGKGTPDEIEEETLIYSKLHGISLKEKTAADIRTFMEGQGIGVDCSGFAVHVYDVWLREIGQGGIYRSITFPSAGLYRNVIRWLRPVENIGANLLTGPDNARTLSVADLREGDAIRMYGLVKGMHVAIIWDVTRDGSGHPTHVTYVHSTEHYGQESGVRKGKIEIINLTKDIAEQKWVETDENGICWTQKQLQKAGPDGGLRRPFFFDQIESSKFQEKVHP